MPLGFLNGVRRLFKTSAGRHGAQSLLAGAGRFPGLVELIWDCAI
jgi:hypothetical protein